MIEEAGSGATVKRGVLSCVTGSGRSWSGSSLPESG